MFAATKPMSLTKASGLIARPILASKARQVAIVVRSADEKAPEVAPPTEGTAEDSTVFYAGANYSESEWKEAVATGKVAQPAPNAPSASSQAKAVTIGDLMAFSGAPELINGRLAMLAFIAALGAELSSGESVLRQVGDAPTLIALTFITFSVASLIPMFASAKREAFGPFTPDAEMANGRAAMLGFASLLLVEGFKGAALF